MKFDPSLLRVTLSPFMDGMALQTAVGKAFKGASLDLSQLSMEAEVDGSILGKLLDGFLSLVISVEVRDALFKCAERALYGNDKINADFFEPEDKRELYYPIMTEVLKTNLGPFIKGLGSMFSGLDLSKFQSFLKSK